MPEISLPSTLQLVTFALVLVIAIGLFLRNRRSQTKRGETPHSIVDGD